MKYVTCYEHNVSSVGMCTYVSHDVGVVVVVNASSSSTTLSHAILQYRILIFGE